MPSTTIVLETQGSRITARAITKILELKDGFAVVMPYHNANSCYLMKVPLDYSKEMMEIPHAECVSYEANSRAKLSVHFPGFAQFSGEDNQIIISGRDPLTKEPRGLGVVSHEPFDIRSGPVVIIGFWGLEDFREAKSAKESLILKESHGLIRNYSSRCLPEFLLEIWMVPQSLKGKVFDFLGTPTIQLELPTFSRLAYPQNLTVVPLPGKSHFLGVVLVKCVGKDRAVEDESPFAHIPPSGFNVAGPSVCDESGQSWGLQAFYPRGESFPTATSLDRVKA